MAGQTSNPPGPGSIRSSKTRSNLAVSLRPGWHRIAQSPESVSKRRATSKPFVLQNVRQGGADCIVDQFNQ